MPLSTPQNPDRTIPFETQTGLDPNHWAAPLFSLLAAGRATKLVLQYSSAFALGKLVWLPGGVSADHRQTAARIIHLVEPLPSLPPQTHLWAEDQIPLFADRKLTWQLAGDQPLTQTPDILLPLCESMLHRLLNNELAALLDYYRVILNAPDFLIWYINRDGYYTSYNQAFWDTILAPRYGDHPPKTQPKWVDDDAELAVLWQNKYDLAFAGQKQEFEFMTRDPLVWWHVNLFPIPHTHGDAEVAGVAKDITIQKLSALELVEREEAFRHIFESFSDIYFQTDENGDITLVSPSVKTILGYEPVDLVGRNAYQLFTPAQTEIPFWRGITTDTRIDNYKLRVKDSEGQDRVLLATFNVSYGEGKTVLGTSGIIKDITTLEEAHDELKRAQLLAQQSLKSKEMFMANMSHEIRTPLTGLSGSLELLEMTPLDYKQRQYLAMAQQSNTLVQSLIQDFLDVNVLESDELRLEIQEGNLLQLVTQQLKLYQGKAADKGLEFTYFIDPRLPTRALYDEKRLLQVLNNLMANALKFTEKGSISVAAQLLKREDDVARISLVVNDSGIGLTPDQQQQIFNKFSADTSSTKYYQGVGLGLTIARRLSHLMNGEVTVSSTPNVGSRFQFTFETSVISETKSDTPAPGATIKVNPMRLLLVDDNSVNRLVITELLRAIGLHTDQATSGAEAINLCSRKTYDLVLMDVQMPGMDGVTAMQHIRALPLDPMPVIVALTAYAMSGDRQRLLNEGMDDYLPKPVTANSLSQVIQRWQHAAHRHVVAGGATAEPVTEAQAEPQIVNMTTLEVLRNYLGTEKLHESLQEFSADTHLLLEDVKQALKKPDMPAVVHAAHTIKGNALTLGIEKVGYFAREVEKLAGSSARFEAITLAVQQMQASFNEFETVKSIIL